MWESELANAQLVLTRPHIIALTWADFYTTEEYSIESTCRKADSQCKALQPSLIPLHWVVRLAGRVCYGKVVSSYKKIGIQWSNTKWSSKFSPSSPHDRSMSYCNLPAKESPHSATWHDHSFFPYLGWRTHPQELQSDEYYDKLHVMLGLASFLCMIRERDLVQSGGRIVLRMLPPDHSSVLFWEGSKDAKLEFDTI